MLRVGDTIGDSAMGDEHGVVGAHILWGAEKQLRRVDGVTFAVAEPAVDLAVCGRVGEGVDDFA